MSREQPSTSVDTRWREHMDRTVGYAKAGLASGAVLGGTYLLPKELRDPALTVQLISFMGMLLSLVGLVDQWNSKPDLSQESAQAPK